MQRRVKTGFTLIELLVVIAIIAILATILFPVFARARENARRASCMSNMKQIGLGVMMYVQDYDEKYPLNYPKQPGVTTGYTASSDMVGYHFYISDSSTGGQWISWMDLLYPYTKSMQIYICPNATNVYSSTVYYPSYGYNSAFHGWTSRWGAGGSYIPIAMSAVQRPSEIFLFIEYNRQFSVYTMPGDIRTGAINPTSSNYKYTFMHLDGTNVTYADGHVKWLARNRVASTINTTDITTCNITNPSATPNSIYCSRDWNPFLN